METLGIDAEASVIASMRRLVSEGISPLEPAANRRGSYHTRWNLLVNVPERTLEQWRGGL